MADQTVLKNMGFVLKRNVKDNLGHSYKFGLYPVAAGGINYFNSQEEVNKFLIEVQVKRMWEAKFPLELGDV